MNFNQRHVSVSAIVSAALRGGNHAALLGTAERACHAPEFSPARKIRATVVKILAATYGWAGGPLPGTTSELLLRELHPESNLWGEVLKVVALETSYAVAAAAERGE